MRRVFELASLRKDARALKSPRQWGERQAIQSRCDRARAREKDLYASRYLSRVEQTRRRLIDEAAQKSFDLKPAWAEHDRFDAAATLRQAQREVREAHHQRIARIDDFESQKLRELVQRSMRENNWRGKAREEFGRVTDRRSGIERRGRRNRPRQR
ncbi:hypothetical protein GN330_12205 [Nitratireductor sp. CAU 1489]|uniref:Uncharacterized protein n=1 Tax=Nitratireductor arenosus TaxID=2682096 RepID=A0A844QFY9_9HYPH|nr:hypothetical protein [Nitratireductor arenosus]MVA98007.1 hypothetical protein [Nitratireductor arenosus]